MARRVETLLFRVKSERIPELDGIRGIAVLMVLVWHYYTAQTGPAEPLSLEAAVRKVTELFWSGVDLFFVLSGFLIGGIILEHQARRGFLATFWIRRCCRILPALVLLLLACLVGYHLLDRVRFAWLFDNLMPWWSYATFTQNIMMGARGTFGGHFLDVTWSLAVEEQFYIFAPLLVLALGPKVWVRLLPVLIVAALALRIAFPGFHTFVDTPFRMDSLLTGFLLAAVMRNDEAVRRLESRRAGLAVLLLLGVAFTLYRAVHGGFGQFEPTTSGAFAFTWFAFFYGLLILVVLLYRGTIFTALLRAGLLAFFGAISYGLYLYHQPVSGLLHGWLSADAVPRFNAVTGVAFLVSVAAAWLSLRYWENPFVRLGRRRSYGGESRG